ncbi:MAG TPA: hypothetical protein VLA15_06140 [Desulfurivibrionaceae bacterium]|nr:hypothetical protein [Desulfurivibrionaceae bacterium]
MRRSQFSGPDNLDYFSGMEKLKMLKGLYFPGLRPDSAWATALLPLLEQLVVYGVVEEESADAVASATWTTRLVAPLGEDAQRFRSLLREMTGREGAAIRGQLLATASRPGRDRDEASAWRLTNALHQMGGDGAGENLATARAERIWQARLLLKLAEAVTSAEAEICLSLAALADKQAEMLQALQGDDDDDEPAEVIPVAPWSRPLPGRFSRVREQLAAWAVFYLLDPEPEQLLLTDDPEAATLLVDEVEKRLPGGVVSLPELELDLGESARSALLKGMQEMLAGQDEAGRAAWLALAEASQDRLAPNGASPLVLRLQLLPGPAFRLVMAQLSGLAGEDGDATASPYVLLGSVAPR